MARNFLRKPFADYDAKALLSHFRTPRGIRYFPVMADPEEVTAENMEAVLENRFELNGQVHKVNAGDWTSNPAGDTEWLILLHKFYYAVGLGMAQHDSGDSRYTRKWMELTDSWITAVPEGFLSSDVSGRRIQNWVYAHYYFVTKPEECLVDADFYERFLASLQRQAAWLRRHLTPSRNHRTLELGALFLVGVVFPEFLEAEEWRNFAISALLENMRTDLLPDGVQCELSSDYHHIVLRNYLVSRRLAALNGVAVPAEMDEHIRRALEFAKWVHRPDGMIPSLSDGDTGSFLDLLQQGHALYGDDEMLYVATRGREGNRPRDNTRAFEHAGYYILRSGWGSQERYSDERYLIFDCGPLGAGNHGHLDFLSFEAYACGRSLVVDPGRYTYDESGGNWRALFRGSTYHNTVTVDGCNQIRYEFQKTRFKICGAHPERELHSFSSTEEISYIQAVCHSKEYDVRHERRIVFVRGEYWIVSDLLSAAEQHEYEAWFHLGAEAQDRTRLADGRILSPHLVIACTGAHGECGISLRPGFVSPRYGVKLQAPIVRVHRQARHAVFHTVLVPFRRQTPRVRVECQGARKIAVTIADTQCGVVRDEVRFDPYGTPSFRRRSSVPLLDATGTS